jgi:hypothetical protein
MILCLRYFSSRNPGCGRGRGRGSCHGKGRGFCSYHYSKGNNQYENFEEGLGEEEDPMNVNPNRKYELDGKVDPSAIPPRTIIPIVKDSVNNFQG